MSLHVAADPGRGASPIPGVIGAFGGFADDARIEDGMIGLPDRTGHRLRGAGRSFEIMLGRASMSGAGEPLLDADHAAFIQSGVSIIVASRDATNARGSRARSAAASRTRG